MRKQKETADLPLSLNDLRLVAIEGCSVPCAEIGVPFVGPSEPVHGLVRLIFDACGRLRRLLGLPWWAAPLPRQEEAIVDALDLYEPSAILHALNLLYEEALEVGKEGFAWGAFYRVTSLFHPRTLGRVLRRWSRDRQDRERLAALEEAETAHNERCKTQEFDPDKRRWYHRFWQREPDPTIPTPSRPAMRPRVVERPGAARRLVAAAGRVLRGKAATGGGRRGQMRRPVAARGRHWPPEPAMLSRAGPELVSQIDRFDGLDEELKATILKAHLSWATSGNTS